MKRIILWGLRDLLLSLLLGIAIGAAVGVLLWLAGLLGGGVHSGLVVARSGLLLLGGFGLLFGAGLLLKGGRLPKDAFQLRPWAHRGQERPAAEPPRLFRVVDRRFTSLLIAAGILLAASVPDWLLRGLH